MRFMEYVVEMVSGGMIYIPSFRRSEVIREDTHTDTHRQQGGLISYFYFFQDKEVG
jgi:hypothetical protein